MKDRGILIKCDLTPMIFKMRPDPYDSYDLTPMTIKCDLTPMTLDLTPMTRPL